MTSTSQLQFALAKGEPNNGQGSPENLNYKEKSFK